MDTQKRLSFLITIKIITIIFTSIYSISLHSQEKYAWSRHKVTSCSIPGTYGSITEKILTSLDNNNKIFACYSGYQNIISYTKNGGGYIDEYIYSKKENVFKEIDSDSKIEHTLYLDEKIDRLDIKLDNEQPIDAIARHQSWYLIAQKNILYICEKKGFFNNFLCKKDHCIYPGKNSINKIFINQNNNKIIAISQNGNVFYHDKQECFLQPLHSIHSSYGDAHYNEQQNILLIGAEQNLHIIDFNPTQPMTFRLSITPNRYFTINIISTSDSGIVLSDVAPTENSLQKHHSKDIFCCKKIITSSSKLPDCEKCKQAKEDYEQQIVTFSNMTITEITQQLHENKPTQCVSEHFFTEDMPDSCEHQTILLIKWQELLKHLSDQDNHTSKFNSFNQYIFDAIADEYGHAKRFIQHLHLINNILHIHVKKGEEQCSGFISKINSFDISANLSSEILQTKYSNCLIKSKSVPPYKKIHWLQCNNNTLLICTNFFHHGKETLQGVITSIAHDITTKDLPKSSIPKRLMLWTVKVLLNISKTLLQMLFIATDCFIIFPIQYFTGLNTR